VASPRNQTAIASATEPCHNHSKKNRNNAQSPAVAPHLAKVSLQILTFLLLFTFVF